MKNKAQIDFSVIDKKEVGPRTFIMDLRPKESFDFSTIRAGQFVEILVPDSGIFLRRPISICDADADLRVLRLLIARVGAGTNALGNVEIGDTLNILLPLGNGFPLKSVGERPLLVGGGVGTAPMLYLARKLNEMGIRPDILLGGRTHEHLLLTEYFTPLGNLYFTTDDGSAGEKGLITNHSIWHQPHTESFVCGPTPMMKAVAQLSESQGMKCYVSLENKMACGIGACLCCVQENHEHHNVCVCTDGPVFLSNELTW